MTTIAETFQVVSQEDLEAVLEGSTEVPPGLRKPDAAGLLVHAFSPSVSPQGPSWQWRKTVLSAVRSLGGVEVQVLSVPIDSPDNVLTRHSVRLRGVPALVVFREGKPDPVQYLEPPDRDRLKAWLARRLGVTRGLGQDDPCDRWAEGALRPRQDH